MGCGVETGLNLKHRDATHKPMQDSTEPKLSTKSVNKRRKFTVSFPEEAVPIIQEERKRLKMSMSQFVNSLVAYQCWCEKRHHLTGDAAQEGGAAELAMWKEIIADRGKEKKTGSYFAHAAAEIVLKNLDA